MIKNYHCRLSSKISHFVYIIVVLHRCLTLLIVLIGGCSQGHGLFQRTQAVTEKYDAALSCENLSFAHFKTYLVPQHNILCLVPQPQCLVFSHC